MFFFEKIPKNLLKLEILWWENAPVIMSVLRLIFECASVVDPNEVFEKKSSDDPLEDSFTVRFAKFYSQAILPTAVVLDKCKEITTLVLDESTAVLPTVPTEDQIVSRWHGMAKLVLSELNTILKNFFPNVHLLRLCCDLADIIVIPSKLPSNLLTELISNPDKVSNLINSSQMYRNVEETKKKVNQALDQKEIQSVRAIALERFTSMFYVRYFDARDVTKADAKEVIQKVETAAESECSVCYYPYTVDAHRPPRLLPCGHTFCFKCLSDFLKEDEAKCPKCLVLLPHEDISRYPPNYDLIDTIKKIQAKEDAKKPTLERILKKLFSGEPQSYLNETYWKVFDLADFRLKDTMITSIESLDSKLLVEEKDKNLVLAVIDMGLYKVQEKLGKRDTPISVICSDVMQRVYEVFLSEQMESQEVADLFLSEDLLRRVTHSCTLLNEASEHPLATITAVAFLRALLDEAKRIVTQQIDRLNQLPPVLLQFLNETMKLEQLRYYFLKQLRVILPLYRVQAVVASMGKVRSLCSVEWKGWPEAPPPLSFNPFKKLSRYSEAEETIAELLKAEEEKDRKLNIFLNSCETDPKSYIPLMGAIAYNFYFCIKEKLVTQQANAANNLKERISAVPNEPQRDLILRILDGYLKGPELLRLDRKSSDTQLQLASIVVHLGIRLSCMLPESSPLAKLFHHPEAMVEVLLPGGSLDQKGYQTPIVSSLFGIRLLNPPTYRLLNLFVHASILAGYSDEKEPNLKKFLHVYSDPLQKCQWIVETEFQTLGELLDCSRETLTLLLHGIIQEQGILFETKNVLPETTGRDAWEKAFSVAMSAVFSNLPRKRIEYVEKFTLASPDREIDLDEVDSKSSKPLSGFFRITANKTKRNLRSFFLSSPLHKKDYPFLNLVFEQESKLKHVALLFPLIQWVNFVERRLRYRIRRAELKSQTGEIKTIKSFLLECQSTDKTIFKEFKNAWKRMNDSETKESKRDQIERKMLNIEEDSCLSFCLPTADGDGVALLERLRTLQKAQNDFLHTTYELAAKGCLALKFFLSPQRKTSTPLKSVTQEQLIGKLSSDIFPMFGQNSFVYGEGTRVEYDLRRVEADFALQLLKDKVILEGAIQEFPFFDDVLHHQTKMLESIQIIIPQQSLDEKLNTIIAAVKESIESKASMYIQAFAILLPCIIQDGKHWKQTDSIRGFCQQWFSSDPLMRPFYESELAAVSLNRVVALYEAVEQLTAPVPISQLHPDYKAELNVDDRTLIDASLGKEIPMEVFAAALAKYVVRVLSNKKEDPERYLSEFMFIPSAWPIGTYNAEVQAAAQKLLKSLQVKHIFEAYKHVLEKIKHKRAEESLFGNNEPVSFMVNERVLRDKGGITRKPMAKKKGGGKKTST